MLFGHAAQLAEHVELVIGVLGTLLASSFSNILVYQMWSSKVKVQVAAQPLPSESVISTKMLEAIYMYVLTLQMPSAAHSDTLYR